MLTYGESVPENRQIQEKDELKNERERERERERKEEQRKKKHELKTPKLSYA